MPLQTRRTATRLALAALFTACGALPAQAADRVIKLMVGFPPGGGSDAVARVLADKLKDELGVAVVVENKAGAGGQLAAQALKAAAPDGNTYFLSHDHTISILPLVVKNPGFDPARDFIPVAGFATFPNALALAANQPAKGLAEHAAALKAAGGKGSVGIPAPASVPEFLVKVLAEKYGLDLVPVPYRGSGPMMADLFGGQIPAAIGSAPEFLEPHRAGKLKVVAVMGDKRHSGLPEVPTLAELGIAGFEELPYYGVFAPAGTPAAEVERFSQALLKVAGTPAVRERLTAMGLTVQLMSGPQLASRERAYSSVWQGIIRRSGFQPQ